MAKSYVKALYDYHSEEDGDLIFKAGDLIQVLKQIDENWIKGEHGGLIGLFPANFVEPTVATDNNFTSDITTDKIVFNTPEKIVVANETYISGDESVLTFFRGDELTFIGYVDDYWCRGSYGGEVGLFPAHMVDGLGDASLLSQINNVDKNADKIPLQENTTIASSLPQQKTLNQSLSKPHAKALFDFKGLSDFELSFPAGEVIILTDDIDEDWFEGSYNGSMGIFPKSFVEVLVPLDLLHKDLTSASTGNDVPYAVAIYPFVGETSSELSFREGDTVFLHHWVSPEWIQGECNGNLGIFPSSFVQIKRDLPTDFNNLSGEEVTLGKGEVVPLTQKKVVNSLFKIGDKALAIYSYVSDIKGDLHLEVGDLIWIEQVIDEEWVLGKKDEDNVGLCPAVFLELQPDEFDLRNSTTNSFESGSKDANAFLNEKINHVEPCLKNSGFEMDCIASSSSKVKVNNHNNVYSNEERLKYSGFEMDNSANTSSKVEANNHGNVYSNEEKLKYSGFEMDSVASSSSKVEVNDHSIVHSSEKILSTPSMQISPNALLLETRPTRPNTATDTTNATKASRTKPKSLSLGPKPPLAPKPMISPKPDYLMKPAKPVPLPKSVMPLQESLKTPPNNWVKFDDQNKTQAQPKSWPAAPRRIKNSGQLPVMSYQSLLDKSIQEDLKSTLQPISPSTNKGRPALPPRVDLALSSKLLEQANEFEKSSSKQNLPSLNELRQLSWSQKPVPAKRNKQPTRPLSFHGETEHSGFPILIELGEQITKINNELQKENHVLSGVEVLIQNVNKDTSRRGELESQRGITEKKIEDLKKQFKKTEDQKKRLVKLLAGYSSQEQMQLKIQQLQESIKENTETRINLQELLGGCDEEDTRNELQDNITFCDEAIKNLKSELDSLLKVIDELEGKVLQENLGKNIIHRKKVIDEILNTEKSFGQDLNLCLKHFMMQLFEWKVEIIDFDLLFGNMNEVAALSSRLLQRLETATNDVDINDQVIGMCFVDFSDEITIVYGKYCRNHDDAIAFLEKSGNNEEIQQYFRRCLESIREFSNCWDLSSFLIKPVQRILKYPLLLNELLKNTPDEHPDMPGLIKAIEVMTIAANDVNEGKRRKELVQKYHKVEESGLSTKFQKFTWHSVVKKSSRLNQRITQFTGFGSQTVDQKFNENEKLFHQIEKTAKTFIKNITQYIQQFEEVHVGQVQAAENIIDFFKEDATAKEIQEYNAAQRFIGEDLVNKLKHVLDEEVLTPLNTLISLFQGPHRLIQKRHDKCLDYDSWSNKVEKIKDREKRRQAKDELELAKKNYEALNAQLLEEVPFLNAKSLKFLQTCIANFACVHKNFFVEALDQFSPSVQLSVVNSGNVDVISDFFAQNKLASHEVFQLAFTPKKSLTLGRPVRPNVSPKASRLTPSSDEKHSKTRSLKRSASESKRKAPPSPSGSTDGLARSRTVSAADRNLLMKKKVETINFEISPTSTGNSTYIVKYSFNAEASTELSVSKDDIVRVLDYHDAFGHGEWWKVEHNGKVGFVPSSFLVSYTSESTMALNPNQTSMVTHQTSFGSGQDGLIQKPRQASNGSVVKTGDYVVMYDFESHGPSELGVVCGDVVKVIKESDISGSNEWWLVEAQGRQGYVPASYLAKRE